MRKLIDFFKNRVVITLIGIIVISLLIWFVGPQIKFGADNKAPLEGQVTRLIIIMVILLLWGLNNLRVQLQIRKNNESLVQDLQVNQSGGLVQEQTSEEVHQITERFFQALAVLKKYKFKGFGFNRGLYELPWYIIIGPPGSGKTTALTNSTLDFPLAEQFGKGSLRGVGGTRNCDWWFTNDAVLIDTAGRYTTQDSHKIVDSSAWEGFLDLLRKHRRRRPINGVIVAISVQDLLTQTEEERSLHARTIRTRIDELMDKLEIRFPIYMVFTKSDLVAGFTDFFDDLSKDEREQIWGISLPNAPQPLQSPDFDFLEQQYHHLIKRLHERVLWRLHEERDIKRRAAIQGFPLQMENLGKTIQGFVQQTFIKNRYRYQPYLRGVYFTSGTQDGTPVDRLMSAVAANFGFDRQSVQTGLSQGKSYFLGQLFKNVIFPESELVGSNRRYELFIRWSQRAAYVGLASLVVIMFVVWAGSLSRHEQYTDEIKSYVADFNAEKKRLGGGVQDIRAILPALNSLAKAGEVYDREDHPWLSSLGMYDGSVDAAADNLYQQQLKAVFLPKLIKYIEGQLRQADQGYELYNLFRVYLMFNKIEHRDAQLIADWFDTAWGRDMPGAADARAQLMAHLQALLAQKPEPVALNQDLIRSVRADLIRVPISLRIYSRIRADAKLSLKVNLLDELGGSVKSAFVVNEEVARKLTIPLLFTKDGYESVDLSPDSELIANVTKEQWVLTDDNSDMGETQYDSKEISEKVKEYYYADYRAHWQGVYEALNIKPFSSVREANETLSLLTDPINSPLLAILRLGTANTQLTNQILTNTVEDNKVAKDKTATSQLKSYLASQVEFTPVDNYFRDLHVLLRESTGRPAAIGTTLQALKQLQEFVNEIAIAPEPDKKSFEVARSRYAGGGGNAITSLSNHAKNLPEPLNRWLNTISNELWRSVLGAGHGFLASEWRSQVYEPYLRRLKGRYPFDPAAQDEVAINDFTEFFKPNGVIDKFSLEYVQPFIDTRSWSSRGVDNQSIGLSANVIQQLKRAQEIKTVFFSENPAMPMVTFQLRPYDMKKSDVRFMMEMGEKRISYSHGPKFWDSLGWSASESSTRIRLLFEDINDQQYSTNYEGPWAWFRLVDRSKLTPTSSANVYLVTLSHTDAGRSDKGAVEKGQHSIAYEIKAKSVVNPFNKDLLGSFRIPEGI